MDHSAVSPTITADFGSQSVREVTVVVDRGRCIAGMVADTNGAPVTQASVTCVPQRRDGIRDWEIYSLRYQMSSTFTGTAGRFVLCGLTPGTYQLYVSRFGETNYTKPVPDAIAGGGDTNVRLVVPLQGHCKGRIRFDDGSTPREFRARMTGETTYGNSGANAFYLRGVPAGRRSLMLDGPEFAMKIVRGVVIEPNKVADIGTVIVKRGRSVNGRITLADGSPAVGANVVVGPMLRAANPSRQLLKAMDSFFGVKRTQTDTSGEYDVKGLKKGRQLTLVALHGRSRQWAIKPIPSGTDYTTVNAVLKATGTLVGRVTNLGRPVVAKVSAQAIGRDGSEHSYRTYAGVDGYYHIAHVVPGRYQVMAERYAGGGSASRKAIKLTAVDAGETRLDLDLPTGITLIVFIGDRHAGNTASVTLFAKAGVSSAGYSRAKESMSPDQILNIAIGNINELRFHDLEPGLYSLCLRGMTTHCEAVSLKTTPKTQRMEIDLPARE
jgi:hypothetical protein